MSFKRLFSAKIGCVMIQLNKWLTRFLFIINTPFKRKGTVNTAVSFCLEKAGNNGGKKRKNHILSEMQPKSIHDLRRKRNGNAKQM